MQFIFWPIGFVIAVALLSRAHITITMKSVTESKAPETSPDKSASLTDQQVFDEEQKQVFSDVTQRVQELFLDKEVKTDGRTE